MLLFNPPFIISSRNRDFKAQFVTLFRRSAIRRTVLGQSGTSRTTQPRPTSSASQCRLPALPTCQDSDQYVRLRSQVVIDSINRVGIIKRIPTILDTEADSGLVTMTTVVAPGDVRRGAQDSGVRPKLQRQDNFKRGKQQYQVNQIETITHSWS